MLRLTFGARRPEQESFYIVTIACRVTERERNQIYRRRRHSRKQQNYCRPKQRKSKKKIIFDKWGYFLKRPLSLIFNNSSIFLETISLN